MFLGGTDTGMHTGEVVMFRVAKNGTITNTEIVRWHTRPITALASIEQVLVSGHDDGAIVVSQGDDVLSKICSIDTYE